MADEDFDINDLDPAEPENWKKLREYAERQAKAAKEGDEVRRENAFLRAGIDLSTRLGHTFAQTYAGKLDDVEAIRADAREFDPRILVNAESTEGSTGQEGQQGQEGRQQVNQQTGSEERNNLADGATPPGGAGDDIARRSLERAKELVAERSYEIGAGELVAMRARALADGQLPQNLDQRTGNRLRG